MIEYLKNYILKIVHRSRIVLLNFCILFLVILPLYTHSVTIKFPEKELPSEYALPYFEKHRAVLNRNVSLTNRFIFSGSYAFRADEPFFFKHSVQGSVAFYWNESHGIGISTVFFPFFVDSANRLVLNNIGAHLRDEGIPQEGTSQVLSHFDSGQAPAPFFGVFVNYQFSPLYGKLSLGKKLAVNFSLYSFWGLGIMNMKQQGSVAPLEMMPAAHFGLGQRFYFNRWISLDGGADFLVYKGFNPVDGRLRVRKGDAPATGPPDPASFNSRIFFRVLARVGCTVLL